MITRCLSIVAVAFILFVGAAGEELPIKIYTSANGLASSAITHVARDSHGFLWFSNRDGLSRFDGTEFVNYRLPHSATSQTFRYFLETRDGWIWLATDDGLYRTKKSEMSDVEPRPQSDGRDRVLDAKKVWTGHTYLLFEDSRGTLWIGGSKLHRVDDRESDQISITTIETPHTSPTHVFSIAEASDGSLWLAMLPGPTRILPDGRQIFYPIDRAAPGDEVYGIDIAADGRVWFAHGGGLYIFRPETSAELVDHAGGTSSFLKTRTVNLSTSGSVSLPEIPSELLRLTFAPATALFKDGGRFTVAMGNSLFIFEDGAYRRIGGRDVLSGTTRSIASDNQNGLWLGSTGGVIRFAQDGLVTYGAGDGLTDPQISSIFESPTGDLLIAHGLWRISRFTEEGIESAVLNLPSDVRFTWTSDAVISDPRGDLYALAREGLFRFPAVGDLKTIASRVPDEFPEHRGRPFYRSYESSDGRLWLSLRGNREQNGLLRLDPSGNAFEEMHLLPGYPREKSAAAFAEDSAGNVWLGFYATGGVSRFSDGSFTSIALRDPEVGGTMAMLVDRKGRLWIGTTSHGVFRIKKPTDPPFETEQITESNGLASNNVRALVDDQEGNVYVGTVRGVDRISLDSDSIRHFSTDDGLAADFINTAFRDRHGAIWFGTPNGLSRLMPSREKPSSPPLVFINELQIAGESYGISEFGQVSVRDLDLSASQNNLQITAVGVGPNLLYQYKLDGSSSEEWSPSGTQRTFNFASLSPGRYTLYVRAISGSGIPSATPATVSFVINPPFYRSWWFLTLVAFIVVGSVIALDRYRVSKTRQVETAYNDLRKSEAERDVAEAALEKSRLERLAELERVRTRIATDLHDDIGSSLTQIAVLSQAAHNEAQQRGVSMSTPLERISNVSVELVGAMSDIVWAINPRRDNVRDLAQRMRRFAADVFTAKGIKFEFNSPPSEEKIAIGANIRREVFAIFKEAVNNVMRHSSSTTARVTLAVTEDTLSMRVEDDGRGFDPEALMHMSQAPDSGGGNGLINMRRRAEDLGGSYDITSTPGSGTVVTLEVPLAGPRNFPPSHPAGESDGPNDLDLSRNGNAD